MTVCRLCSTEHSPGEVNCPSAKASPVANADNVAFAATNVGSPAASPEGAAPVPAAITATRVRQPAPAAPDAVSDEIPVGTVIGYWTITRKLGEGGMGAVYAATAEDIGTTVAVKVLSFPGWRHPGAQAEFDNAKERFHREAKAASKLKHPNVIGILAYGSLPDGRPYFVMEYLPGHSLDVRLRESPPRGAELSRLLMQVCDALAAIHLEGIVHRDLKPENIWVVEPKQGETFVKLLDFGISKMEGLTRLTETGAHAGTPYYEAPEQLDGKNIGPHSDIYAFGAVLYEIFTGQLLFGGQSLAKIFHDILFAEPPPLVAREPYAISPELGRLILDCLNKKPERRPESALALKERLRGAMAEGPAAPFNLARTEVVPLPVPDPAADGNVVMGPATAALVASVSKSRGTRIKAVLGLAALALGAGLYWEVHRSSPGKTVVPPAVAVPAEAPKAPKPAIETPPAVPSAQQPHAVKEVPASKPGLSDRRSSPRRLGTKASVASLPTEEGAQGSSDPAEIDPAVVLAPPPAPVNPPQPSSAPPAPSVPAPEPSRAAHGAHRPLLLHKKPELIYKDLRTDP